MGARSTWMGLCIWVLLGSASLGQAAEVVVNPDDDGETLIGPKSPQDRAAWLEAMRSWRDAERQRIGYSPRQYERPELAWTQRSYIQPQVMVEDRYLYDSTTGRYTPGRFLDDLAQRYGGVDAVLLWAVYPNIGIDSRNQHDLLHDMPGGLPALRELVQQFHQRGVRVLFPVMPWDTGTRPEALSLEDAIARDLKEIGADGINGDTLSGIGQGFLKASERAGYPFALEPEGHFDDQAMLAWNTMSWGYWAWWKPSPVPLVSRYKWVEPRHMVNICERWARDRSDQLQQAFFNGVGYESWENIWGIWNGITPRDAQALRRIALIERATNGLLVSQDWQPHVATEQAEVYASVFPGDGQRLWTVINRSGNALDGAQLHVPHTSGERYFDLWNGVELTPQLAGNQALLSFSLEPHGYGAVLATDAAHRPAYLDALLAATMQAAKTPLASLPAQFTPLRQQLLPVPPTPVSSRAPAGMVYVPPGHYRFRVSGIEIEGNNEPGVDVQYPWEDLPRRHHDHVLDISGFYIDRTPVTNAQFAQFISASGYRPADAHNYLRDWLDGAPRPGWQDKPVTWVSIEDARAYAAWAGKRLPHEWEWQYAAQGTDGRAFPWGDEADASRVPEAKESRELRGPDNATAHLQGASPFGVLDMTGNVWQWTDEYADPHTRAAIVRGGSYYHPAGSLQGFTWYFPQEKRLTEHGKLLLLAPAKDRSGTVGFRCVVDAVHQRQLSAGNSKTAR
jgi:formylglycine-generating enzyme required for sulfatase activity